MAPEKAVPRVCWPRQRTARYELLTLRDGFSNPIGSLLPSNASSKWTRFRVPIRKKSTAIPCQRRKQQPYRLLLGMTASNLGDIAVDETEGGVHDDKLVILLGRMHGEPPSPAGSTYIKSGAMVGMHKHFLRVIVRRASTHLERDLHNM